MKLPTIFCRSNNSPLPELKIGSALFQTPTDFPLKKKYFLDMR